MNAFRIVLAAATVSAAGLATLPALADGGDDRQDNRPTVSRTVDHDAAIRHARAAGVLHIEEIEMDDGHWEVEGRDARGREIDLQLHPGTGKVLARELDDDRSWWGDRWDD